MSKDARLDFSIPETQSPTENRRQMVARLKREAVPVLFKTGLDCWQIAEVVGLTIEETENALRKGFR